MAKDSSLADLTDSLSAPLGDLIAAVGRGVADAQRAMDQSTITAYRELLNGVGKDVEELRRFGFQPTWYRIPEVEAELTVTLSVTGQGTQAGTGPAASGPLRLYAAPVDASYVNRYEFDLQASSRLRFKIVPVPPAPQASEVRVVPELPAKFGAAREQLGRQGIPFTVRTDPGRQPADTDEVVSTEPRAREILLTGESVVLTLRAAEGT
jgi:hypothetical protein